MDLKKNQEIRLIIEDFTKEGEGLGKYQGIPFFVKDTVIGDEVRVSVTKLKKNYGYARLVEILHPSPDRVVPSCPVARQCGGCKIQQLSYEKQKEFKWNQVAGCLQRIGGFTDIKQRMEPILAMKYPWHYRNKAQYPIGRDKNGNLIAGFYAGRTHQIIANTDCLIQAPVNRQILEMILSYMKDWNISPYREETHRGLVRHVLTRVGFVTGEIMVCLIINGSRKDLPGINQLIKELVRVPGMTSIVLNYHTEKTNRILGNRCETLWGKSYIEDYIGRIRYRIGPLSFFQVNPAQTGKLYEKALEYADLHGTETVWDMYCGIGSISLFLAQKARRVYGVEVIAEAVEDARCNAHINGITNVEFFVGKAEEVVPKHLAATGIKPDVVVVDPPRKGCDPALLQTILVMAPRRIVYVSCDPATLARDCKILCQKDYEIRKAAVVDQFAHSVHVETVCSLVLRKPVTHINIDVDVEELVQEKRGQATYEQIKAWVLEHSGLKVSNLYIAQVKQKYGIIERENYNKPKSENPKQPQCPPEKEKAIRAALKHFQMI